MYGKRKQKEKKLNESKKRIKNFNWISLFFFRLFISLSSCLSLYTQVCKTYNNVLHTHMCAYTRMCVYMYVSCACVHPTYVRMYNFKQWFAAFLLDRIFYLPLSSPHGHANTRTHKAHADAHLYVDGDPPGDRPRCTHIISSWGFLPFFSLWPDEWETEHILRWFIIF